MAGRGPPGGEIPGRAPPSCVASGTVEPRTATSSSPRIVLRPFSADDAVALHAYLSREDAVRFEPYGVQSERDCERLAAERAADERFVAVCLAGTGDLIGNLYCAPEGPPTWRTWGVGYVLHPDHWGRGYATEALLLLLADLFDERAAHRVVARCDPRNARSWRLLERVGMRREAHVLEGASFADGPDGRPVWHDAFQYALLRREWDQHRSGPGQVRPPA